MAEIVAHENIFVADEKTLEICARWDRFCHDLFHSYQDVAVAEVNPHDQPAVRNTVCRSGFQPRTPVL
jgi:hypothetical protein